MSVISVWNKGKRTWIAGQVRGLTMNLEPNSSVEMEEIDALKFINLYPRDVTTTGIAGPSSTDLARKEQSLKDRALNLDKREAELDAREENIKLKESGNFEIKPKVESKVESKDETKPEQQPAKKAGRPPKDKE